MNCAAEEHLIRLRLESLETVRFLDFDLANRLVSIYHDGEVSEIDTALASLNLDSSLTQSTPADTSVSEHANQHRTLWIVLLINAGFFAIEITTGVISKSMGLIADSLDMLADALVYGMSLAAVGTSAIRKKSVAKWSGYFQLALAIGGFLEVLRRFFGFEALPDYRIMIFVSALALAANALCLYLLQRTKSAEAHLQASMIFTSNDIIINFGVIAAGVLVSWLNSNVPDLIVGGVVFLVVTRGAFRILVLAK